MSSEFNSLDQLYTTKELADKLGVKPATISRYRYAEPRLPYLRFGRTVLFIESQVTEWLLQYQAIPDPYRIDRMRRLAKKKKNAKEIL